MRSAYMYILYYRVHESEVISKYPIFLPDVSGTVDVPTNRIEAVIAVIQQTFSGDLPMLGSDDYLRPVFGNIISERRCDATDIEMHLFPAHLRTVALKIQ